MDNQNLHNEIMRAIGHLEGTVKEGFKNTENHFKSINGKVERHDKEINALKTKATILWGGATLTAIAVWEFIKSKIYR
ncbi:MAG: hypothetical protein KJI72_00265 [Patescibacteria group bacterium]|nr:hypothetical protein [Patescibacteria group bacterium]